MIEEHTLYTALALFCTAVLVVVLFERFKKRNTRYRWPPGPRGLPLIGNALDMPREEPYKGFAEWGRQYGESSAILRRLISLDLFCQRGYRWCDCFWPADDRRQFAQSDWGPIG